MIDFLKAAIVAAGFLVCGHAGAATVYDYQGNALHDRYGPVEAIVVRLTIDETKVPGGLMDAQFELRLGLGLNTLPDWLISAESNYDESTIRGPLRPMTTNLSLNLTMDQWGNVSKWWVGTWSLVPESWYTTDMQDVVYFNGLSRVKPGHWTKPMPTQIPASGLLLASAAAGIFALRQRRRAV